MYSSQHTTNLVGKKKNVQNTQVERKCNSSCLNKTVGHPMGARPSRIQHYDSLYTASTII
jgi:hypothetical protein